MKLVVGLIVFLITSIIMSVGCKVNASVSSWQKGISVYSLSPTDFATEEFKESLKDLRETGANYVTLIIPIYQDNLASSTIYPGIDTPSDETLVKAIQYAHSIGLMVMLKPHVEVLDGEWRAYINPINKKEWFDSYTKMLLNLTLIAQQNSVEAITLGTELYHVTSIKVDPVNEIYWDNLISTIRNNFSGKLSYSAQHAGALSEKDQVSFWDELDFIGMSAYFDLALYSNNPSIEELMQWWSYKEQAEVLPLYKKYNKEIVFTEIGYRSLKGSHKDPWNADRTGEVDLGEQVRNYEALFSYWDKVSYFKGVHLWTWYSNPNAGGVNDSSFTPQNKPSIDIIKKWFKKDEKKRAQPFNINTKINIENYSKLNKPQVGQILNFRLGITSSNYLIDSIVNLEIYNSKGEKILQQFFEKQNFISNFTQDYLIQWRATEPDTYTLKAGIFNSDWKNIYEWNDSVLVFKVENDLKLKESIKKIEVYKNFFNSLSIYKLKNNIEKVDFSRKRVINEYESAR